MSQLQVTGEAKIRDIQGPVVANSGVITALDGAASQYVRGDGTLADFPTSTGGGSSVSYYLNSSVSQGTIGGVAYRELSKDPIIGAGTDITISANGYVANYITDANDPDVTIVPGGNFNCEFYFSVNNNTGSPTTYAELYKYDGTTFTLLGTSAGVPESINQGTTIAPYYFAIPVATAALSVTDRLAIRIYVSVDGRTVTLHTENGHLCQVVTTLSKGMVSLNNLTDQSQYLATGTSGTDFNIVSSGDTHTFNIPSASATNRGLITTGSQTFSGSKTFSNTTLVNTIYIDGVSYLKNLTSTSYITGYTTYSAKANGVIEYFFPSSFKSVLDFNDAADYTYTFPAASGTIALTSNLSSYVPYTGATGAVDLGTNELTSGNAKINDTLYLKLATTYAHISGYYGISVGTNIFVINNSASTQAVFSLASLTTSRTFTLPDANGMLALTSNLSAYLPLAGGTLTGALSGTSATFSDTITSTGSAATTTAHIFNNTTGSSGTAQYYADFKAGATLIGRILRGNGASGYEANGLNIDNFAGMQIKLNTLGGSGGAFNVTGGAATFSSSVEVGQSATIRGFTGTTGAGMFLAYGSAGAGIGSIYSYNYGTSTYGGTVIDGSYVAFYNSGSEKMRITGGNVGIGTTAPSARLAVHKSESGASAGAVLRLENTGANYTSTMILTDGTTNDGRISYLGATQSLGFGVGSTANQMIITSSGNVGVGTTAPTVKLHSYSTTSMSQLTVDGAGAIKTGVNFASGGTTYGQIYFDNNAPYDMSVLQQYSTGSLIFGTNNTERLRIANNGLLYSLPTYANASGSGANVGVFSNGEFYRSTSSLKYKKNVENYTKGLAEVMQMRPVTYNSINEREDGILYAGLIAEEVHDLGLTEFVQYAEDGSPDALAYQNMVSLLVKAIQEQQAQIEELKSLINK